MGEPGALVGADPHRLRRPVALHPGRLGERPMIAATVAGTPVHDNERLLALANDRLKELNT